MSEIKKELDGWHERPYRRGGTTPTPPGDGGPAFPFGANTTIKPNPGDFTYIPPSHPGMSLRAYLAGRAMQGMLSNWGDLSTHALHRGTIAIDAVAQADALLAELEKEQKPGGEKT